MYFSDDIDSIITSAKNMVKSAKDVTNNVLDELLPIQADVEKMKSTYGSTQSAGFSKALMEANNSGIAGAIWDLPSHCQVNMVSFVAEVLDIQKLGT